MDAETGKRELADADAQLLDGMRRCQAAGLSWSSFLGRVVELGHRERRLAAGGGEAILRELDDDVDALLAEGTRVYQAAGFPWAAFVGRLRTLAHAHGVMLDGIDDPTI